VPRFKATVRLQLVFAKTATTQRGIVAPLREIFQNRDTLALAGYEPALNRIVAVQECDARKAENGYKVWYIIHPPKLFLTLFILNKTFILQKNTDEEYFYNT
jgi:hypothetical protein